jgi:hypothetical protein
LLVNKLLASAWLLKSGLGSCRMAFEFLHIRLFGPKMASQIVKNFRDFDPFLALFRRRRPFSDRIFPISS